MPDRYDDEARRLLDGDDPAMAEARRLIDGPAPSRPYSHAALDAAPFSAAGMAQTVKPWQAAPTADERKLSEGLARDARVEAGRGARQADWYLRFMYGEKDDAKIKAALSAPGGVDAVLARADADIRREAYDESGTRAGRVVRNLTNLDEAWQAVRTGRLRIEDLPPDAVRRQLARERQAQDDPTASRIFTDVVPGLAQLALPGGGSVAGMAVHGAAGESDGTIGGALKGGTRGAAFAALGGAAGRMAEGAMSKLPVALRAPLAQAVTGAPVGGAISAAMGDDYGAEGAITDALTGAVLGLRGIRGRVRAEAFGKGRAKVQGERDALGAIDAQQDAAKAAEGAPTRFGRPLTPPEAGAKIAEAVQTGQVDVREVASQEALSAIKPGMTPQEAAQAVSEAPRPVRADGSRGDGYSPDALEAGKVEPGAVPLVKAAQEAGYQTLSSGQESPVTGKPWVLAVDPQTGKPVRFDPDNPPPATKLPAAKQPANDDFATDPATGMPNYLARVKVEARPLKPVPKRPKASVEEMGNLTPIRDVVARTAGMGRSAVSGFIAMSERAARGGSDGKGGPAAAEAASKFRQAAHETRAAEGDWADHMRAVEEASKPLLVAGPRAALAARRAAYDLHRPIDSGKGYGRTRLQMILEGEAQPSSPAEARIVDAERGLIGARGKTFEDLSLMVDDPATGQKVPFKAHDNVMPRVPLSMMVEVMRDKAHRLRRAVVKAFADINQIDEGKVEAIFDKMATDYGELGSTGTTKTTQAEHRRYFDKVPYYIKDGEAWVPLYESNPLKYARAIYHGGAARVGVLRTFGQDLAIDDKGRALPEGPVTQLQRRYAEETGREDVFYETMRAASGRPVETPGVSSRVERDIGVAGRAVMGAYKTLKLSATAIYNALEPLLRIPDAGAAKVGRAYFEALASGVQRLAGGRLGEGYRDIFKGLERHGAIDVEHRPTTHRFVQGVGARAMQLRAAEMRARAAKPDRLASDVDAGRLRGMGYDDATARRLADGKGTATEYRDLINNTAPRTTGVRMQGQELGRLEQMRKFRILFPIARFAIRQMKIVGNSGAAFARSMGNIAKAPTQGQKWRDSVASGKHLAETVGGATLVGAGNYLLYSLAFGGKPAFDAMLASYKDEPEESAVKAFVGNSLGGPVGAMLNVMRGDRDIVSAIMPVAFAREVSDLVRGESRYKDMGWSERAQVFAKGAVPALRVADTALVGAVEMFTGEANREQEWREALKAMRGWKRDEKVPDAVFIRENPAADDEAFTSAMRRAYRAIKANASPEQIESILEEALAVEGKGGRNLRSSLEVRLVFDKEVSKRKDELKARIGDRAFEALEAHDALIQSLMDSVTTRSRSRSRGATTQPKPLPVDREALRRALREGSR